MCDSPFSSYLVRKSKKNYSLLLLFIYLLFLIPTFSLDINADQTAEQIELKIIQDVDIVSVTCASTFI